MHADVQDEKADVSLTTLTVLLMQCQHWKWQLCASVRSSYFSLSFLPDLKLCVSCFVLFGGGILMEAFFNSISLHVVGCCYSCV